MYSENVRVEKVTLTSLSVQGSVKRGVFTDVTKSKVMECEPVAQSGGWLTSDTVKTTVVTSDPSPSSA